MSLLLRRSMILSRALTSVAAPRRFTSSEAPRPNLAKKDVEIILVKHDGTRIKAKGKIGESILDVVVNNNIDLEGYGACEGTLTCSTCQIVLKQEDFDSLPDRPTGEEADMLELAHEATPLSRLGCQVFLSEKLDGVEITVPEAPTDLRLE